MRERENQLTCICIKCKLNVNKKLKSYFKKEDVL